MIKFDYIKKTLTNSITHHLGGGSLPGFFNEEFFFFSFNFVRDNFFSMKKLLPSGKNKK